MTDFFPFALSGRHSSFLLGLLTGVLATVFVTHNSQLILDKDTVHRLLKSCPEVAKEDISLDHIVLRVGNSKLATECKDFWKSNFGFDIENEDESIEFSYNDRSEVAFPSIRMNNSTTIDLYYDNMQPFFSPSKNGTSLSETDNSLVDRISIALSGEKLLKVLNKFDANDVIIDRVVGDYFGEDGHHNPMFWGPTGARGVGVAVFLFEPNGMYVELRTYDLEYVSKIKRKAENILNK